MMNNNLDHPNKVEGFSLNDILSALWRGKYIIIGSMVLFAILGLLGGRVINNRGSQVTTIISLDWEGLEAGEYPDGQTFVVTNMFNANVINLALKDTDLTHLNVNDVRKSISIQGIVPNDIVILVEQSLRRGETMTYIPTEYRVTLKHGNLGISYDQGILLLTNIFENYRIYFENKFNVDTILTPLSKDNLVNYDYPDIYVFFESEVYILKDRINQTLPDSARFVSHTNGMSFNNLLTVLNRIESTLLRELNSGLESADYIISKNPQRLKIRYENELALLTFDLNEQTKIRSELLTLIDTYKGGEHVVIIPGVNGNIEYATNPYLSNLYDKLVDIEYKIALINKQIAILENHIDKLVVNQIYNEDYLERIEFFEATIDKLIDEFNALLNQTNIVLDDYNKTLIKDVIVNISSFNQIRPLNGLVVLVGSVAVGAVVGLVIALTLNVYQNNKTKQNKPKADEVAS